MPVGDSKLNIVLSLKDEASKGLNSIQRDLKSFGGVLEDSSKDFRRFGVGITAVGVGLAGLLVKTGLTAARVQVLGTVMRNVGKISGISTDILNKQEASIKKLGITTKSARELLIRFMQGQLDVADASKIARVAQDLAVISGQNSSDAAETLTQAIIAQRPVLLRQFGIVKDLSDIYKTYADTLEKSSEDLTDVEKRQALLNVILSEGAKVAGTYEAAMGDVGKQLTSLPRLIIEAETAFGEAFLPVMERTIQGISGLLKQFNALPKETKKTITQVVILTAAVLLILGPLLLFIGSITNIIAGFSALAGMVAVIKAGFILLAGPISLVIAVLITLGIIIFQVYKNWDKVKSLLIAIWEAIRIAVVKEINEIRSVFENLVEFFMGKLKEMWDLLLGLEEFLGNIGRLIGNVFRGVGLGIRGFLRFQEGGIVPGPIGASVPAIVHGGERIIPAGKSAGIVINITGNTLLDENVAEEIGDKIIEVLKVQRRFVV